jgi:uncharacterized membrane protein HdeD (DUF308 family)
VTLISGVALVFIGIWLWSQPAQATLFLWQVIGWYWLITGILNIVMIFVDSTKWGWKLTLGIIGIIAGLWIINNPVWGAIGGTAAIVLVLGIQAIIYGIVALIAAFQGGGWGAAILGIISIVLGFLLLGNWGAATLVTPWVIAIFAIVGGVVEIVVSFMQRSSQKAAG